MSWGRFARAMSVADAPVELDLGTDEEAPARVARVRPEVLLEVVRAAVGVDGAIWLRVTGKSMNPIIRHGDRVLIVACPSVPARGAVVLMDAGGVPLLHRIVSHRGGSVITRGDNRSVADQPRPATSIVGRALVVRRDGTAVCLAPTLAFGVAPLLRAVAWWLRMRLPGAWAVRLGRMRVHAR
jgi:hypothetical protein